MVEVRGDGSPQLTLLTVMTKLLFLGIPLVEVIRATTVTPATIFGFVDRGTLQSGKRADLAILELAPSSVELFDIFGQKRIYDQELRCRLTVLNGRPIAPKEIPAPTALDPDD